MVRQEGQPAEMPREQLKGYVLTPQVFEDCPVWQSTEHSFRAGQAWVKFCHCYSLVVNVFTRKAY